MNILANIYLTPIDNKYLQLGTWFRYADDILFITDKNPYELIKQLKTDLKIFNLKLNLDKTQIIKKEQNFDFLGYYLDEHGIGIRAKSIKKFKSKIKRILKRCKNLNYQSLDKYQFNQMINHINKYIDINSNKAWLAHFKHITNTHLLKNLDMWLVRSIQHTLTNKWGDKNFTKVPISYIRGYHFGYNTRLKTLYNQYFKLKEISRFDKFDYFTRKDTIQKILLKTTKTLNYDPYTVIKQIQLGLISSSYKFDKPKISYNKFNKPVLIFNLQDRVVLKILSNYIKSVIRLKTAKLSHITKQFKAITYNLKNKQDIIKIDIRRFSDNIDRDILKEILSKLDLNPKALKFIFDFFDIFNQLNISGLSRGNALSSVLKYLYLMNINNHFNNKLPFLNYADDYIFIIDKQKTQDTLKYVTRTLNLYSLNINQGKLQILSKDGYIDYLGFRFNNKTKKLSIDPIHLNNMKRRIKKLFKKRHLKVDSNKYLESQINKANKFMDFGNFKSPLAYYRKINDTEQLKYIERYVIDRIRIAYFRRNRYSDNRYINRKILFKLGLNSIFENFRTTRA